MKCRCYLIFDFGKAANRFVWNAHRLSIDRLAVVDSALICQLAQLDNELLKILSSNCIQSDAIGRCTCFDN